MPAPPVFALSSALFVQRDGQILILKRAVGEAVGTWYLPGGALDPDETIEECAKRELLEEAGLVATGPLTVVGVAHMHVYGQDSLQVLYACDCTEGDVVISNEHSGYRWVDPVAYRDRYFNDGILAHVEGRTAEMLRNVRTALDAYLAWIDRGRRA